ncbi:ankyrin protein [Fusarium phyllophilum]|uniref:Ankyrin protein n=1 Tax=Fusarium phyllophilum TaxID=47803 RepID=A0A8H5NMJ1_9HYPO|nr:ankyrin protein [Fusarium phyllophilum]
MSSSADTEDKSPYCRFAENPNAEYKSQGLENFCPVPMTMLHSDGSILYETVYFGLLHEIVVQNDTNALQIYLTIAPWAVSIEPVSANDLWAVPDRHLFPDECDCDVVVDINYCMSAASQGSLGVLKILLDHCTKGKNPDMKIRFDSEQGLLLNEAAQHGQVDIVRFLLDNQPRYASIYERDQNDHTALLSAASAYNIDLPTSAQEGLPGSTESEAIINLLLDRGASASDVSYGDEKLHNTVLTLAAEWAGSQLIKRLIDNGANIYTKVTRDRWEDKFWNIPDSTFEVNALYVACTHGNFEAVKTLIDCRGTEVDFLDVLWRRDSRGSLPLHWVAQCSLPKETFGYSKAAVLDKARSIANIIELLLDLDPTIINVPDNDGNTPLHYATRSPSRYDKMYTPIIQLLCTRGGDASIQNTEGQTPLHTLFRPEDGDGYRVYFRTKNPVDTATVVTLLAHGASPTDIDMAGDTPLHIAAANLEWADVVSLLLVHGADPALQNLKGQTALHCAAAGTYLGLNKDYKSPERIRAQEDVLSRLVKAGGVELMDLTDSEGLDPREICHKTRHGWKELDGPPKQTGNGRGPRMHKI